MNASRLKKCVLAVSAAAIAVTGGLAASQSAVEPASAITRGHEYFVYGKVNWGVYDEYTGKSLPSGAIHMLSVNTTTGTRKFFGACGVYTPTADFGEPTGGGTATKPNLFAVRLWQDVAAYGGGASSSYRISETNMIRAAIDRSSYDCDATRKPSNAVKGI